MTTRHHPADDLLLDYATGALSGPGRLVLAAHLEVCIACQHAVADAERIGGVLLSGLPAAPLQADALAWALARIERPAPVEQADGGAGFSGDTVGEDWIAAPQAVLRAARRRRRWAAPGVWVAPVVRGPGQARSYLLGVGAGMGVPRHTHRGLEMVCVLKGAYRDGDTVYGPGDFACSDETIDHRPVITDDGECVCLIAAEGPLVPRDWVGRLFQPLVGI